jgi:predicted nucleic acid-binding protein
VLVVDASALLEVLLDKTAGRRVAAAIAAEPCCAPDLVDAEVLHRLVTLGKHGAATSEEVRARVGLLRDAPLVRVPTRQLLDAALPLTVALSGYDAVYVALARLVTGTLLTGDARLARTAHEQFGVTVRSLT